MVSGINNIGQISYPTPLAQRQLSTTATPAGATSFDNEDEAIISSEAKLLNELDKFNSGNGDAVNLAVASVVAKTSVAAEATVFKAKNDMIDEVLKMGN